MSANTIAAAASTLPPATAAARRHVVRRESGANRFFGARQPAEPRIRLLLAARLFEERAAGPEMRQRALGRALRGVDRLVIPLQAEEDPQLVGHHVAVVAGEELPRGGNPA